MVCQPTSAVQGPHARARPLWTGGQRQRYPAPAVGVIAASPPEPGEGSTQPQRGIPIFRKAPCQGGAQIVVLDIQAIHRFLRFGATQAGLGPLRNPEEEGRMTLADA